MIAVTASNARSEESSLSEAQVRIVNACAAFQPVKIKSGEDLAPFYIAARNSEGLDALLHLWASNQHNDAELAWYRAPYRSTRLLVLALYYGTVSDTDDGFFPRFRHDAMRFEPDERRERLEEIDYVESRRDEFRSTIQAALKK